MKSNSLCFEMFWCCAAKKGILIRELQPASFRSLLEDICVDERCKECAASASSNNAQVESHFAGELCKKLNLYILKYLIPL